MALYNIKAIAVITDTDETALVQLDELAGAINQYQVDNQYTTPFRFIKEDDSGRVTFVNYKEKFSFKGIPVGLIGFDAAGGLVTYPLESKSSTQQSQLTSATFVFDGQPLTIPIYNSNGDGLENSAIHANTSGNYGIDVEDPQYKWDVRNGSINITQNTIDDGYRLNGHLFATINSEDQKIELGSRTGSPYNLSLIKSGTEIGLIDENGLDLHDYLLSTGAVQFDLATSQTNAEGKLQWNATDRTLEFGMGGGVIQQIGQELPIPVKHADNSGLENGKVVYVVGSSGTNKTVRYAQANDHATSDMTLGVMTETVTGGEKGLCTTFGLVRDLDTSALTEGAVIYLSDSVSGGMTSTKPTSPNHAVVIGICIRSHATVGSIWVSVDTGNHLAELHDVYISSVANNDILKYVSANSRWENASLNSTAWLLDAANTLSAKNYIGSASGNYDIGFKRNNTEVATLVSTGINLPLVSAATTDTDRFLVSDSGTIKYRTGAEVLSDIGGQATGTTWLLNAGNILAAKDFIGSTSGAYDIGLKRNNVEVATLVSGGFAVPNLTQNYVVKAGSGGLLSNSQIFDNGTNVGIGIISPSNKLVIDGGNVELRSGNYIMVRPTDNTYDWRIRAVGSGAATYMGVFAGGDLANPKMTYLVNGRVGIGTTSPGSLLDVRGQISASLGSSSTPAFSFVGDLNTGVFSPAADTLAVATGGVERIRVGSTGNLGIGVAVGTATSFRITKAITGGIISYGTYQDGVISSDVTSAAMYNKTIAATQAASFTLGELRHFSAGQGTIGAGSSVIVQTAFFAESSLTGAFINYGYRGAIASGSNRWNLYMDGTAQNYIRGNVGIGVSATTPSEQLYVNGTGRFTGAVQFDTVPSSLQDATSANHLVRYSQWIASTSIKYLPTAVKTVSLTNITLSGTQTVNGVALIAGDRILVAGQTTGSQNGVYVVAAGAWTRATDADSDSELRGFIVSISGGTYAGYKYINTNQSPITVDTTTITYAEFSNISEIDPVFVAWRDTTRTANTVYAGPTSGSAAIPTFRALVSDDIPNLAWSKITSGTPTTLAGYGITDAYTDAEVDVLLGDYYTSTEIDTMVGGVSNFHIPMWDAGSGKYIDSYVYYGNRGFLVGGNPGNSDGGGSGFAMVAIGDEPFGSLTTGNGNIGIGDYAGYNVTTGDFNVVVGYQMNWLSAASKNNIIIGSSSIFFPDTLGNYNTVIGGGWFNLGALNNHIVIGDGQSHKGLVIDNNRHAEFFGNIKYLGLLKPSGTAGTSGQVLSTNGTNDAWVTLTTSYISNLSSYTGFDSRYYTETEIDNKLATITSSSLTANTILYANGSKQIASLATATYPSLTELSYVKGVTSSIQTQLNLKANLAGPTFTGTVTLPSTTSIGTVSSTEIGYLDGVTSSIQTQFSGKEPTITAGTTSQYWRGDKTWQTLNTTAVTEGSNLYFTEARVRSTVLTGYTVGSNAAISATDSILGAFGKAQGQINGISTQINASGLTIDYVPIWDGSKFVNSGVSENSAGFVFNKRILFSGFTGTILIGALAGESITSGTWNTIVGWNAGRQITTGFHNSYFGVSAGQSQNGSGNTYLGYFSGRTALGDDNVAIGKNAFLNASNTSSQNTIIGVDSGRYHGTSSSLSQVNNSTFIGYNVKASVNNENNSIGVGHNVVTNGSNTATWGNTSITEHYFTGNIRYSGTLKPSGVAPTTGQFLKAASASSNSWSEIAISDVTSLSTTLDGKAPLSHTHTLSQLTDLPQGIDQVDDEDMVGLWVNDVRGEIGFVGKANSAAGGMIMYNKYSNAYTWIDDDGNVNLKGTQGYLNSKRILTTDDLGGTGGGGLYGLDDVLQYDPVVFARGAVYRTDANLDIIQIKAFGTNVLRGAFGFVAAGTGWNDSRRIGHWNYESTVEMTVRADGVAQIGDYTTEKYVTINPSGTNTDVPYLLNVRGGQAYFSTDDPDLYTSAIFDTQVDIEAAWDGYSSINFFTAESTSGRNTSTKTMTVTDSGFWHVSGRGEGTGNEQALSFYRVETLSSTGATLGNYDKVFELAKNGDVYMPHLANSSYLAVDSSGKLVPTTGGGGVDQGLDSVLSVDNTALNKSINLDATTGATNIRMKQSGTLKAGINYDTAGIFSIYTQPTVDFNIIADDVLNLISSTQVNISGPSVRIKIGAITYLLSVDGSGFLKGTIV